MTSKIISKINIEKGKPVGRQLRKLRRPACPARGRMERSETHELEAASGRPWHRPELLAASNSARPCCRFSVEQSGKGHSSRAVG